MTHRANTVVFAYSDIGVRCLAVLLANPSVHIRLVVTHRDSSTENIWFDSVAALAALNDIPVITPDNANAPEVVEQLRALKPDVFFSFYFRQMLSEEVLSMPRIGAFNMHGSLLPKYRGRAPVNWCVLRGETETGATLHRMVAKPDAGNIVAQQAVAILPNDTAYQVHQKVAVAAEQVLMRSVTPLVDGSFRETAMDISQGNYCGGRKPEDGRLHWHWPAAQLHNLIRAVAPPYPGAFFDHTHNNHTLRFTVLGSYFRNLAALGDTPRLYVQQQHQPSQLWADCVDGKRFQLLKLQIDGVDCTPQQFAARFGNSLLLK